MKCNFNLLIKDSVITRDKILKEVLEYWIVYIYIYIYIMK